MKIKLLRNRRLAGKRCRAGDIIDIDKETAVHLLNLGDAEAVKTRMRKAIKKPKETAAKE